MKAANKLRWQPLSASRRLSILALAIAISGGGFFIGAKSLEKLAPLKKSIHKYYFERHEFGDQPRTEKGPLVYGAWQLRRHFCVDKKMASKYAAFDLLFPLLYGLTALIAYRIILLGFPRQVYWGELRERILFSVPMTVAVLSDWIENLLILFLYQECPNGFGTIPPELAVLAGCATLIKFVGLIWAYLGLSFTGVLVLWRGHRAA